MSGTADSGVRRLLRGRGGISRRGRGRFGVGAAARLIRARFRRQSPRVAKSSAKKRRASERWAALRRYADESRAERNALLLTVPILLAYQAGLLVRGPGAVNAAHAMVEDVLLRFGRPASVVVSLALTVVFVLVAARKRRPASPAGLFLPVVAESSVYAAALAPAVHALAGRRLAADSGARDAFDAAILALGAGFYEELIFRLVGVAGGYWVLRKLFRAGERSSAVAALVLSAVAFSAFHHVGPGAEAYTTSAFLFRFAAGNLLGLLFVFRGFGVACYTHAIYNLMVRFG